MHAPEPLLVFDGIAKIHGRGALAVHALDGVNLTIATGEYVAVTGPSGSGKSTFLNIAGCLDRPTCGHYLLDGREASALAPFELSELRKHTIGFVFQSFNLLPRMTAAENVSLPLVYLRRTSAEQRKRAIAALEVVGMGAYAGRYPGQLSGGQQQRVAIARALVTAPRIVFADEPTGALDADNAEQIMSLFEVLHAQGITLVMVTHDRAIAARAHRVLEFRSGKIVSDGLTGVNVLSLHHRGKAGVHAALVD
jgi:putative ABC transport system ATP-binding protein